MSTRNVIISRRQLLRSALLFGGGAVLAACTQKTETATREVEEQVTVFTPEEVTEVIEKEEVATAIPAAVSSPTPNAPPEDPRRWVTELIPPPHKYEPELVITQNFGVNEAVSFLYDETSEDNVVSRWIEKEMGVVFKPVWTCNTPECFEQKWAATMASGDLPELMVGMKDTITEKLHEAGAFEDITEIWEETASDLTKQNKEYPNGTIWRVANRGGRVYGIPYSGASKGEHDMLTFVRNDWLEKVNLPPPTTLDEVYEVGKAFVDAGLAEMGIAMSNEIITWMSSADPIFGAFGVMPMSWIKDGSGGLVYGSLQDGVKDALAEMHKWYDDGVIGREFVTSDAFKTSEYIAGCKAGIFFGPFWCVGWPSWDAKQNDPEADWIYLDVPAGPNNQRGRSATSVVGSMVGFRKGVERIKVEAVINQLNWMYDLLAASSVGTWWWFEGYDYEFEDDEVVLGQTATWAYIPGGGNDYAFYPDYTKSNYEPQLRLFDRDPATLNPVERYYVKDPMNVTRLQAYLKIAETMEYQIPNEFTGTPTPTMLEVKARLDKLETETFVRIITGDLPLSAFDTFVKDWKAQGGDEVSEEVNDWYASL